MYVFMSQLSIATCCLFLISICRLDRLERHYQHVHLDIDVETLVGMLCIIDTRGYPKEWYILVERCCSNLTILGKNPEIAMYHKITYIRMYLHMYCDKVEKRKWKYS